tara:strand:+ start:557 stop:1651 length:1095 start_codon:yes stop_codon:yes gene_type:complete
MEVHHEAQEKTPLANPADNRRRGLYLTIGFMMLLPILLAPTHPIAVYAFLADTYGRPLIEIEPREIDPDLEAFLITPHQLSRYRDDLRSDMLDTRTGWLFAIVRGVDGRLEQAPIRTWNTFLPDVVHKFLGGWLDQKEIPYLGDAVALWMDGGTIVAMGHYHPFGGGPSAGDRRAQSLSLYAEVVVSNGVIPMVYVEGEVVPYGAHARISVDVFRNIRALEKSLLMEVKDIPIAMKVPSRELISVLAYLRDYRGANLTDKKDVAATLSTLCLEFRAIHEPVFQNGFSPLAYQSDPDKLAVLHNLINLEFWTVVVAGSNRASGSQDLVVVENGGGEIQPFIGGAPDTNSSTPMIAALSPQHIDAV